MCAHGLVRTERGEGGPTMIRCGFMPAYFPELGVPPRAHHLRELSIRTGGGREDGVMWFGLLRPSSETTRE